MWIKGRDQDNRPLLYSLRLHEARAIEIEEVDCDRFAVTVTLGDGSVEVLFCGTERECRDALDILSGVIGKIKPSMVDIYPESGCSAGAGEDRSEDEGCSGSCNVYGGCGSVTSSNNAKTYRWTTSDNVAYVGYCQPVNRGALEDEESVVSLRGRWFKRLGGIPTFKVEGWVCGDDCVDGCRHPCVCISGDEARIDINTKHLKDQESDDE